MAGRGSPSRSASPSPPGPGRGVLNGPSPSSPSPTSENHQQGLPKGFLQVPPTPRKTKVRPGSVSLRIPFRITGARRPRPAALWPRMAGRTSGGPRRGEGVPGDLGELFHSAGPTRLRSQGTPHPKEGAEPRPGGSSSGEGVETPPGSRQGRRTRAQGPRAGRPHGGGAPRLGPAGLPGTPALGRPTLSARFQTAAPGRRPADWKFHNDRHQPRARAATPRRSSPPCASPQEPRPRKLHLRSDPNSGPAASSSHAEISLPDGADAPRPSCAARVRGARRGRTGGWGGGSGQTRVPPSPSQDAAPRPPPPRPSGTAGLRPTHPARWRAGRGPEPADSPAPALTHLSASPCRRARRCRVPLCTLRTQTNPPPAPAPPPASP